MNRFANSGEIADPCGVPRPTSRNSWSCPSTPASSHPPHIEQDPLVVGVMRDRCHDLGLRHGVGEAAGVQIDHPVSSPAPFPAGPHRVQRRPPRPVAVRVGVETWLHQLPQLQRDHRLRDPVDHGRHPENPRTTARLGNLDGLHRRREIAPRRHAVPQPIQPVVQIGLELFDRLTVDPRRPSVGPHLLPGSPHKPPGNRKRLTLTTWPAHPAPPSSYWLTGQRTWTTRPLRSTPITRASPLLPGGPTSCPATVLDPSQFLLLEALPIPGHSTMTGSFEARISHVPHQSLSWARATSRPDATWPASKTPARLIPGQQLDPGFDVVDTVSTCHRWFASARLPSPHLTPFRCLFRNRSPPRVLNAAACGGLEPPLAGRSWRCSWAASSANGLASSAPATVGESAPTASTKSLVKKTWLVGGRFVGGPGRRVRDRRRLDVIVL